MRFGAAKCGESWYVEVCLVGDLKPPEWWHVQLWCSDGWSDSVFCGEMCCGEM